MKLQFNKSVTAVTMQNRIAFAVWTPQAPLRRSILVSTLLLSCIASVSEASGPQVREIEFAGSSWNVRSRTGGPGGGKNQWSDSPQSVWVDSIGRLHLKLRQEDGIWKSAEVSTVAVSTYGEHQFYVDGPIGDLYRNDRLGLFLFANDGSEMDIEFAKWDGPTLCQNASFALHPVAGGNGDPCVATNTYEPFNFWGDEALTRHSILWRPDAVSFRSETFQQNESSTGWRSMHERVFPAKSRPMPHPDQNLRVHINLWLDVKTLWSPKNAREVEIVIVDVVLPASASLAMKQ